MRRSHDSADFVGFSMLSDTIVAQATARGKSALAIIRLSGPEAITIVDKLFKPAGKVADAESATCVVGTVVDSDRTIDQVVATIYRNPNSFTGEDSVEISCHGGTLVVAQILDLLERAGARPAKEGEFTHRAFLNGKIDLAQAEAICALIEARCAAGARAALRVLAGGLGLTLEKSLNQLTPLLAQLEVSLDILEEGTPPDILGNSQRGSSTEQIEKIVRGEINRLETLLGGAKTGRLLEDGIHVALVGKPNAGKSSIFNAFLSRDRAIVSPEPGTTRDSLEGWVEWNGLPLVLLDTAGLRLPESEAEKEGIARTRHAIEAASIVVLVVDAEADDPAQIKTALLEIETGSDQVLVALHKWDQVSDHQRSMYEDPQSIGLTETPLIPSSVFGSPGEDRLKQAILEKLSAGIGDPDATLLVGDRQRFLINEANLALQRALVLCQSREGEEMIAFELRNALDQIGEILGKSIGPLVLDEIFSRFCVGK